MSFSNKPMLKDLALQDAHHGYMLNLEENHLVCKNNYL